MTFDDDALAGGSDGRTDDGAATRCGCAAVHGGIEVLPNGFDEVLAELFDELLADGFDVTGVTGSGSNKGGSCAKSFAYAARFFSRDDVAGFCCFCC